MTIYVVQAGDTISSIAEKFHVSETRLMLENGITNPVKLVTGQTIVITDPQEIYIVKEGDTLIEIAEEQGISLLQLFRNNSFLWDREYIYPGEELVISYDTKATVLTNAYAFPFINMGILRRTLPYLTYLSILNYTTLRRGKIESYYDDSELIEMAKQFGVMPIMLVTGVSFQGERNPEMIYEILLNPDYQEQHAQSMLRILKEKGYYGVNITITYLNETNQELYLNYLKRVSSILRKEGYLVFVTIDPNFNTEENETLFEKVDYSKYNELVDEIYLMKFYWGTLYGPPMPVSSVEDITLYVNYMLKEVEPKKINIGFPLLGYDWKLPYKKDFTEAHAITLDNAIDLARQMNAVILFDEASQTPYFTYTEELYGREAYHKVWFVDARTIEAVLNLVLEKGLLGTGLWNIMSYYSQLWLIINSTCNIGKLLPEMF
jgi:Predicted glycosyl hydrolase